MPASPSDDKLGRQEAIELAMKELGTVERFQILVMAAAGPVSAKAVGNALGKSIGNVSHHVRKLSDDKLIRKLGQRRVRGALATDYTIATKGMELLARLGLDDDEGA